MVRGLCPKCKSGRLVRNGRRFLVTGDVKQRWKCKACGHRPANFEESSAKEYVRDVPDSKVYVITAAQNDTPAHGPFLESLKVYCKANRAKLIIVPFRYRNPTSMWSKEDEKHDVWASEVVPYLYDGRQDLNENLVLLGDIKVVPTAIRPLTGFDTITQDRSAILAHTKLQFRTVASPQNKLPKILTTTGAVTVANYTDTKAGKKGEHHHVLGACVAEVQDGQVFHLRQINAEKNGSFYDLDRGYTPKGSTSGHRAEALVMGDTHVDFVDPEVVDATFKGRGSVVGTLKPKHLVWHDLVDMYSGSHHHAKKPFTRLAKASSGMDSVKDEVERACAFVDKYTPKDCVNVIVPSNHHDHLRRWIEDTDWRTTPENAVFYLETALHMAANTRMTEEGAETPHPFNYWGEKLMSCADRTVFVDRGHSYMVKGVEVGMHGDLGPNGARGSVRNLSSIGVKTIIGHSHSPAIMEGCYQVGTSSRLKLEYSKSSPSSWLNTHGVIYPNGKRSLISVVAGRWRLGRRHG